jgi:sugar lactone lactonase YvrE
MKSYTIKKFKIVSDLKHLLAEGPIWDHKFNRYLFVDIKKNYFYIFKNNILKKYQIKKKITSIILTNKENNLIFTTFDSIIMFDLTKKKNVKTIYKTNFIRERFNDSYILNDKMILISSMDKFEKEKIGKLYFFNKFKKKIILLKNFIIGNGIDYCKLKKKFYFSISDLGLIVSFKLEKNKVKKKKIFCKIPKKYGVPDGITVDKTGHVWVSCWNGGCVLRLNQTGKIILSIKVPSKFPTSLCFGGVNFNEILITSAFDKKIKEYGNVYLYDTSFKGKKTNYLKTNY